MERYRAESLVSFSTLGWGDEEANQLAAAMAYMAAHDCKPAPHIRLDVTLNNFSEAGLEALRQASDSTGVRALLAKGRRKPGDGATLRRFAE